MENSEIAFTELLNDIIDNRGRTCPTSATGIPLIATNCIRNDQLYPAYDKLRYISIETYSTWFRGHPEPGDIIFVTKGTPGRVCLAPNLVDFCIAQDMVAVRANPKKIYPKYLFAVLRSPLVQERIEQMHVGTLIPHFKKGDFDKLNIPVPSRYIQEFIGDIYFHLSAKIDLNRRMNRTLEAMARALFQSWFVDFDPVRAKAALRGAEGAAGQAPAGLKPAIAALFPDRLVAVEGREVPEGWGIATLGDVTARHGGLIQTGPFGSQLHASDYVEAGIPTIMPKDISDRRVRTEKIAYIDEADAARLGRHRVVPGDIVYSRRGDVERHALIGKREQGWLCGTGCMLVRPGAQWPSPLFMSLHLDRPDIKEWITQHAIGATMPNLNTSVLGQVPMLAPPHTILRTFEMLAGPLDEKSADNDRQSRTLAGLRDALLPKLISGELRVADAERIVGRCL